MRCPTCGRHPTSPADGDNPSGECAACWDVTSRSGKAMPHLLPTAPAEQQQAITAASEQMRDGDAQHNISILRGLFQTLQGKVPLLEAEIKACPGCCGSYDGCQLCLADRAELAALLGY
jgi:hypothetical protein